MSRDRADGQATSINQKNLVRWARRLAARVERIIREHPNADPDTVRLTLMALELTPEERLQRSLRRGRGFAAFKR